MVTYLLGGGPPGSAVLEHRDGITRGSELEPARACFHLDKRRRAVGRVVVLLLGDAIGCLSESVLGVLRKAGRFGEQSVCVRSLP
jgi:hypothetical protein